MSSADQILLLNASSSVAANGTDHTPSYITKSDTATLANLLGSLGATVQESLSTPLAPQASECNSDNDELYPSYFGVPLAMPEWEAILTAIVLSVIIVLTIIGNTLVILSVFTYKPLRIVQNFFIVSLAVADLTVALLVLPFNVAYSILGRWEFGIHLCKMWLTCDVMCCTSSILNLCAIALDRYWAITDPINYAQKRTVGRVLLLIAGVWILSLLISSPPLIGWNDWPEEFTSATPCELTSNRGYVIYSSLGSFVIPLAIMTIVYIEIFIATRRRLRERAQASKINTIALRPNDTETNANVTGGNAIRKKHVISYFCANILSCGKDSTHSTATIIQNDQDSISSETHVNSQAHRQQLEHRVIVVAHHKKSRRTKIKDSIKHGKARGQKDTQTTQAEELNMPHAAATQLLLPAHTSRQNMEDQESSTPSRSEHKDCIQMYEDVETAAEAASAGRTAQREDDYERISLKTTPPQSAETPLQKKPSGVYQFIEEKQKISLSKERRAARTLGIIMGVFVICWLPFFLMYVILPFCDSCCPTNKFKNFITWLGYINSGLNPVIYTIFNLDYRRAFKRLLGIN